MKKRSQPDRKSNDEAVEATAEYREGREARKQNMLDSDNPYGHLRGFSNPRYRWFVGWYDQNTVMLLERQAERLSKEAASAGSI